MYDALPDFPWILIISSIISLILFIVLFVKIIQISKNVKTICKKSSTSFKLREKAILALHEGNISEATKLIISAFKLDIAYAFDVYYHDYTMRKQAVLEIVEEYSRYENYEPGFEAGFFKKKFDEISKMY